MRILKICIFLVVAVAIVGVIGSTNNKETPQNSESDKTNQQPPTEMEDPPIEISSTNLMVAYDQNEVNADNLYKDKTLKISGTVGTIKKDIFDDAYVTLIDNRKEYTLFSVQCYFKNQDEIDKMANVKPGQILSLVGTCKGSVIGSILMKDCTFAGVIG